MTSPTFLPALLADETVYSWCATAHAMSGWRTAEGWGKQYLDAAHGVRQHDFPAYLPALLSKHFAQQRGGHALRRHTTAGMYWPFIAAAVRDNFLETSTSCHGSP